jgi:hypothetical protein
MLLFLIDLGKLKMIQLLTLRLLLERKLNADPFLEVNDW